MVQELNFESYSDRVPPQNIEAEECILGGILLDPEAIGRVAEILRPEALYIAAHREIYGAALALYSQGQPTDLISVSAWLGDRELLEKVGGQSKLVQLAERTVSAVNIDRYAWLVMDKYLRRQLIQSGNEIVQLGYENATPLESVLDRAEQKVFSITQARPQQALVPIYDTLIRTFEDIEEQHEGQTLPGLLTDFYDLDAMTSGLQRSDLIIVAGRPSMGKCLAASSEIVLSDGSIATIEEIYQRQSGEILTLQKDWQFGLARPSNFIDDGIKPVYRLTTRLGRRIETTATHPYLTIEGWQRLEHLKVGDRIAVPRQIDVFGCQILPAHQVKLMAYFIGDGGLTSGTPKFTNINPKIQADFEAAVARIPGLNIHPCDSGRKRTISFRIAKDPQFVALERKRFAERLKLAIDAAPLPACKIAASLQVSPASISHWISGATVPNRQTFSRLCEILRRASGDLAPYGVDAIRTSSKNALTLWLEEIGLWDKDARHKTIPSVIFQLERSQVALFLNRLFSTDGWITVLTSGQVQLGYCSVSETLARQVQHLLLRFGIIASLKKRSVKYKDGRNRAWQLDITDAIAIKNFIDKIGIWGKEKAIAKAEAALTNRKYQTNRDLIPREIWQHIDIARNGEAWTSLGKRAGIERCTNLHVGRRSPSRNRLFALATALEDLPLQQLATSAVYWDEIVSIEFVGHKQVYDLTIPETHNFVANDICVHNTAMSLNVAYNIAANYKLPVAIFSLEMSKEQLVQRLLASEAGIESNRLRAGRISQNEWEPLSRAIGVLSEVPIYIDDTPNITVTEMRSKARRLQAERGGKMGLVLLDYLQLMEGGSTENRVQELSRMTRALKGLARELDVPVVALSQLSRGVEARNNKRPMMSDLRESGCLTGESLVTLADTGERISIRDLVGKSNFKVWAIDETTMKLEKAVASRAFSTGFKSVFKLKTALGHSIRATGNHKLLTISGWKRLDELSAGERIALPRLMPSSLDQSMTDAELGLLGHLIGDGCTLPRHVIQYTTREIDLAEIVSNLAISVFGKRIAPRINKERKWYQVYLVANFHLTHKTRNPIAQWLDSMGIFGLRSHEKYIPSQVFKQSSEAIATFLRHLWSTDGCIKLLKGERGRAIAYYSTSSEKLARDVQSLLLRLGINARLSVIPQTGKGRDQYHTTVTGKPDIQKFVDRIGAVGSYKQEAIVEICEHIKDRCANTNRDVIPLDVWKMYAVPAMEWSGLTTRQMQAKLNMSYCGSTLYKHNLGRERALKVAKIVDSTDLLRLANSDIYWDKITSIFPDGHEEVYDLTVPRLHNFIANDIVVHNSIEQDADIVLMLYRDEYYFPDTPDRGITEIIIAKHRNGPTGIVKLLFDPQYTRFRNLAPPSRG